jgi:hypothetical protein
MKAISSLFISHLLILALAALYMGGMTPMLVAVSCDCFGLARSVIELTDHQEYLSTGRICSTRTMDTQLDLESGARIPAHERQSRSVYCRAIEIVSERKHSYSALSGVLLPLLPTVVVFHEFCL